MPRYIFQIEGRSDEHSVHLPDVATAKCEAVRYAGKLICDEAERFWETADLRMTVTNEEDLTLFTLVVAGWNAPAVR